VNGRKQSAIITLNILPLTIACFSLPFNVQAESYIVPDQFIEKHLPVSRKSPQRVSHEPLISGDSFRSIADHIIDETAIPFDPRKVQAGDIIFVGRPFLSFFFELIYPQMDVAFFLITSNGSGTAPAEFADYLEENKIITWFSRNVDLPGHPKMRLIPLGICWFAAKSSVELLKKELAHNQQNFLLQKPIFCNLSFSVCTNPKKRQPCMQYFKKKRFATVFSKLSYKKYISALKNSQFVICPEGYNIDSYRIWESLICGAYPIVLSSSIDELFQDLPVVVVHSWQEVNEEFLKAKKNQFEKKSFNLYKIRFNYWKKIILDEKKNYLQKQMDLVSLR
jgi:hypothetical protein